MAATLVADPAFGWVPGAEPPLSYETKYSVIRYSEEKALRRFTKGIGNGIGFFFGVNLKKNPLLPKDRVDKLVERVISIMDMHPKNLRFNIFVYETYEELEEAYSEIKKTGESPIAFYYHTTKTIYVSIEDVRPGVLAHEIAHAVISAYFGVPPPARTQEILARHVDAHLYD